MGSALDQLTSAATAAERVADEPPTRPFGVLVGSGAPVELVVAAGLAPVRLLPSPAPVGDALTSLPGADELHWRGRSYLAQLVALGDRPSAILFSGPEREQADLYASLRELVRSHGLVLPPCRFVDLPRLAHRTSSTYRVARLREAVAWLENVMPRDVGSALPDAMAAARHSQRATADLQKLHQRAEPSVTAAELVTASRAASWLAPTDHASLVDQFVAERAGDGGRPPGGPRTLVVGRDLPPTVLAALEESAQVLLAAASPALRRDVGTSPVSDLAGQAGQDRTDVTDVEDADDAFAMLLRTVHKLEIERILTLVWDGDDIARWDATRICTRLAAAGHRADLRILPTGTVVDGLADVVRAWPNESRGTHLQLRTATADDGRGRSNVRPAPRRGGASRRSTKVLEATGSFGTYQREWFTDVTARARDGEPFAVVSADFPHEILRAMDIPYVVNQWWASIVGAKRLTPAFCATLRHHGYADDVEPYSAQGLATTLVDEQLHPWGGLPTPTVLGAMRSTPPTGRIHAAWARETGARLHLLERTVDSRWADDLPIDWWDLLPDHWDEVLEKARLDLMRDELVGLIHALERETGRTFDESRFGEILENANRQSAHSFATRQLVATTRPAPISVVDQMPATMIPQWHRGTEWAVGAARQVRDEVAARVSGDQGVVGDERLRLMWVGRGLWGDTSVYQQLEETHGAVFVWSMYLGLAADGYRRHMREDQDPLRALASRFVTMGDELRMPSWAGPWHVKEARTHQVDAAVAIADADPFVVEALRADGIPVLRLDLDNLASSPAEAAREQLLAFADQVADGAAQRP